MFKSVLPTQIEELSKSFSRWLCIINCAVLYNLIFVVGRAVFWELQNIAPIGWYIVDYGFDLVYLIDIFIRMHEGNFNSVANCIGQKLPFLKNVNWQHWFSRSYVFNFRLFGTRINGEGRSQIEAELRQIKIRVLWFAQHFPDRFGVPNFWHGLLGTSSVSRVITNQSCAPIRSYGRIFRENRN